MVILACASGKDLMKIILVDYTTSISESFINRGKSLAILIPATPVLMITIFCFVLILLLPIDHRKYIVLT